MSTQHNVPPHNLDHERAVLGALMMFPDLVSEIREHCTPTDFYVPRHQHIYETILEADLAGPFDGVVIADMLTRRYPTHNDTHTEMLALTEAGWSRSAATRYATDIAAMASMRRIVETGREITALGFDTLPADIETTVDQMTDMVDAVAAGASASTLQPTVALIDAYAEQMDQPAPTIPSGYDRLDELTGGFNVGDLNLVVAPSGLGKTAFMLAAAASAARGGYPVLVQSLEMTTFEVMNRLVSAESGVDLARVTKRVMNRTERQARDEALARISAWPIHIDDDPAPTTAGIKSRCRQIRHLHDADNVLVVFDYVQLWKPGLGDATEGNRQAEVAEASRALKLLAQKAGVTILAGAQSNNIHVKAARPPRSAEDIRESSAPFHDSSLVLFLHREGYSDPDAPEEPVTDVYVSKQRNGPTGKLSVLWTPHLATYLDRSAKASWVDAPSSGKTGAEWLHHATSGAGS